jgi:hypothetical protein
VGIGEEAIKSALRKEITFQEKKLKRLEKEIEPVCFTALFEEYADLAKRFNSEKDLDAKSALHEELVKWCKKRDQLIKKDQEWSKNLDKKIDASVKTEIAIIELKNKLFLYENK